MPFFSAETLRLEAQAARSTSSHDSSHFGASVGISYGFNTGLTTPGGANPSWGAGLGGSVSGGFSEGESEATRHLWTQVTGQSALPGAGDAMASFYLGFDDGTGYPIKRLLQVAGETGALPNLAPPEGYETWEDFERVEGSRAVALEMTGLMLGGVGGKALVAGGKFVTTQAGKIFRVFSGHKLQLPRTEILTSVTVFERSTGRTLTGPVDLRDTLRVIDDGPAFNHPRDGITFANREGKLPDNPSGYYQEFTVPMVGARDRGPQRVIRGQGGELYYTPDHCQSFIRLN